MINKNQVITQSDRIGDGLMGSPRIRKSLNRANPLTLSNTWQSIPFRSVNTNYDTNTFENSSTTGARFDETSNTIFPNQALDIDQQYVVEMDFKFSHTRRPLHFQLRYVVPIPSPGTPINFPFPETDGYFDLLEVSQTYTGLLTGNLLNIVNLSLGTDVTEKFSRVSSPSRIIYSAKGAKDYGVIPQLRIAENYTGTDAPKLVDAILFVYPG
jgi:hypothetical protein